MEITEDTLFLLASTGELEALAALYEVESFSLWYGRQPKIYLNESAIALR